MENTSYIALSRQNALQRQMDMIANNLANMNTTGYKADEALFKEYVAKATPKQNFSMVNDYAERVDLTPGVIESTGARLDLAIDGDGFFVVNTPQGERYTRAGGFRLDETGQLVTADNYPVQGTSGTITIPENQGPVTIAKDGTVSVATGVIGQVRVVVPVNPESMQKMGNNLFMGSTVVNADNPNVLQGYIEKSNVTPVTEMTKMIRVQREFEATQRIVLMEHERQQDAIRKIVGIQ